MSSATLKTGGLVLRPVRLDDADAIFEEYAHDPEVTRYLMWRPQPDTEGVLEFLRGAIARMSAGEEFHWVITREGDHPIGAIGCTFAGYRVELGYVLGRAHWGRGIMSEAVRAVVAWALETPAIHRVWACCDVDNAASARVLEKAGMSREGMLRRWSLHPNISDVPRDCYVYSTIRDASARR